MRDDAFSELTKVGEISAANDQVCAIGPQLVEDVPCVAGQSVAGFPRGVPRVGVLVVASDAVFGSEQRFAVVLNDAADGEFKVGPRIHEVAIAVVKFQLQLAPRNPRVAVGGFVRRYAVDGSGGQDVGFPVGVGGVPSGDAA